MTDRIKKTCNGCLALADDDGHGIFCHCSLGYDIKSIRRKDVIPGFDVYEYKPVEPCPKPKTNKERINASKKRKN